MIYYNYIFYSVYNLDTCYTYYMALIIQFDWILTTVVLWAYQRQNNVFFNKFDIPKSADYNNISVCIWYDEHINSMTHYLYQM